MTGNFSLVVVEPRHPRDWPPCPSVPNCSHLDLKAEGLVFLLLQSQHFPAGDTMAILSGLNRSLGKGGVLPHAPHNCQHCLEHLSPMTSSSPPILLEYVPSLAETTAQIQLSLLWGNGWPKAGLLLWFLVPPQLFGLVPLLPSFGERAGPTRRGQSRGRLLPDHS